MPNLAEYHVPVNADVPSVEAILVEEDDPHVNALGIKGVGEIRHHRHGRRSCECQSGTPPEFARANSQSHSTV